MSRSVLLLVLAVIATLVTPLSSSPAMADDPQDCFWTSVFDEENGNLFYPDTGVNYYLGRVNLPPGGEMLIRGRYPHARYISFNAYSEDFQPTDALADVDIAPDPRSTNPFVAGHRRDLPLRDYTVRVVPDPLPEKRQPNTVYLGDDGRPRYTASIVYRVYLPDRGLDQFGGVGLPEVSVRMPDGTEIEQPAACTAPTNQPATGITETDQRSGGPAVPNYTTAKKQPRWHRFFNVPRTMLSQFSPTLADAYGADSRGGFFSDGNNAYVYAFMAREFGPVLVLRGRLPRVPATYDGERRMGHGQLRYWSLCTVSMQPYGVTDTIGCTNDALLTTDRKRWFTVVVSTPQDRPANARKGCGVTWLPFGARPTAALVMRNQLASPAFAHAVQQVRKPGEERAVMGDYLPRGRYLSTRAFEKRGC